MSVFGQTSGNNVEPFLENPTSNNKRGVW